MLRSKQLDELMKQVIPKRRVYPLWVNERDTPADIEAKRQRLIAAGRASIDDVFVHVRWKRRDER
jgi:hypothetical protein